MASSKLVLSKFQKNMACVIEIPFVSKILFIKKKVREIYKLLKFLHVYRNLKKKVRTKIKKKRFLSKNDKKYSPFALEIMQIFAYFYFKKSKKILRTKK